MCLLTRLCPDAAAKGTAGQKKNGIFTKNQVVLGMEQLQTVAYNADTSSEKHCHFAKKENTMPTCTLAVDIGASSGRHIAGTEQDGRIVLQEV